MREERAGLAKAGRWPSGRGEEAGQSGLGCKVNMSLSVTQVSNSPFRESEWDRRLDDMLEDLGGTGGTGGTRVMPTNGVMSQHHQQQQQFSSSSMQQSYTYSSSSQQQHQVCCQHVRQEVISKHRQDKGKPYECELFR